MTEFAYMVSEHIPNLRRYARVLVRDAVHAEDLVQDCLERAISREHLWQQGTNLRAWLFTILHNLYINQYLRHGGATMVVPLMEEHSLVSCPARQFHSMTLRDLARAFDELPEQEQRVVLLVGLEGMQYEDAAETLGVPMGTVKSRLSRARRRLRRLLDGDVRLPSGRDGSGALINLKEDAAEKDLRTAREGSHRRNGHKPPAAAKGQGNRKTEESGAALGALIP